MAQQYYKKPASMGGGANSFIGWTIPPQIVTTTNGTYILTKLNTQILVITGVGTVTSNNGYDKISATATVTPSSVTVSITN